MNFANDFQTKILNEKHTPMIFFNLHGVTFQILQCPCPLVERLEKFSKRFTNEPEKINATIKGIFLSNRSSILNKQIQDLKIKGEFSILYEGLKIYRYHEFTLYEHEESILIANREQFSFKGFIAHSTLENSIFFESIFFPFFIWEMLSLNHLYLIHAAALKSPSGQGMLFAANGRQGKTTITLSLLRNGYSFLSDDMVFLNQQNKVLPYPRDFHIDPILGKSFKELSFLSDLPAHFILNPKRKVGRKKIFDLYKEKEIQLLNEIDRVDFLLFPSLCPISQSRLEILGKAQALAQLIPTSVLILFAEENTQEHMETLKHLVEGAICFRFLLGKDFFHHPENIPVFLEKNFIELSHLEDRKHVSLSRG